jgi:hypothetical protein
VSRSRRLLLEVLLLLETRPDHEIAIAVPGWATFTTLVERLTEPLGRLGIGAFVVREDGRIDEVLAPRPRRLRRK